MKPYIQRLHAPILWTSLPTTADLVGQLNESAVVYYCGDDFSALAGVDHQPVAQYEQELLAKSQLVITASEHLSYKIAKKTKSMIYELLHGVDFELFATPLAKAKDMPSNQKPTAGFYGRY